MICKQGLNLWVTWIENESTVALVTHFQLTSVGVFTKTDPPIIDRQNAFAALALEPDTF